MRFLAQWSECTTFQVTFGTELLRIARTTTTSDVFKASPKLLLNRLMKQGGKPK